MSKQNIEESVGPIEVDPPVLTLPAQDSACATFAHSGLALGEPLGEPFRNFSRRQPLAASQNYLSPFGQDSIGLGSPQPGLQYSSILFG